MDKKILERIRYHMKTFLSTFFLKQLLLTVIAFLLPIKGILILVGLMILADTITGIYKAKKRGEVINSRRLSDVVSKMFLYQGAIVLFFMIDKYLLGDIIGIFTTVEYLGTKIVALTLVSIEIKSIDENQMAITGVSLWTRFKDLIKRAKEIRTDIKDVTKTD